MTGASGNLLPPFYLTGVVADDPTPSSTEFGVTLDNPLDDGTVPADLIGLYVTFTSGPRLAVFGWISDAVINSTTSLSLTLAGWAFTAAPDVGNTLIISG